MLLITPRQTAKDQLDMHDLRQLGWHRRTFHLLIVGGSATQLSAVTTLLFPDPQPEHQRLIGKPVELDIRLRVRDVALAVQHYAARLDYLVVDVDWVLQGQLFWVVLQLGDAVLQELLGAIVELYPAIRH